MAINRSKPLPTKLCALKKRLDSHYHARNKEQELTLGAPDPLRVARRYGAHKHGAEIALICALLSYGNARAIVRFLEGLDFSQLDRLVECFQNLESHADSEAGENLQSPADSEVLAERHALSAIESSFSSEQGSEQALKASSGASGISASDCKGEGATSQFKPLPLNKKEKKESKEVRKTLEAKAGDSEKLDSESKRGAESAMAGDSEKLDLESETIRVQEVKVKDSQSSETDLTTKRSAVVSQALGGAAEFTSASQDRVCELRLANSSAMIGKAYRFQTSQDISALFIIMARVIRRGGIEAMFMEAYRHAPKPFLTRWNLSSNANHARILYAIYACIENLSALAPMPLTQGLGFALGKSYAAHIRARASLPPNVGALKRWNMYLRWMVRADRLDMGLWRGLSRADLILPLDTHTFRLCGELEILTRKSYDLAAALQATDTLACLRPDDPIAYDFALYRIGQSGGEL